MSELSPYEQAILDVIQADFPVSVDPYGEIASAVGGTREAAHAAVTALRARGVIRRLGGSFAAARMGYVSALVACRVDPAHLEAAAEVAGAFDEVTHNYARADALNLWFTVIAADQARMAAILDAVRACPGVQAVHPLPALRTFKLRVEFAFGARASSRAQAHGAREDARAPDDVDRRLVARLCEDIGDGLYPFRALAEELGVAEDEVLVRVQGYRADGRLRRFGAMLRHQSAGFTANAMSVWDVPDADAARMGAILAAAPEVSHAYERPRFSGWPFNVYGMIHARSEDACRAAAARLAEAAGIKAYRLLFSVREFKKTSMRYAFRVEP